MVTRRCATATGFCAMLLLMAALLFAGLGGENSNISKLVVHSIGALAAAPNADLSTTASLPLTEAPTLAPLTEAPTLAPLTEAPTLAPLTEAPTLAPSVASYQHLCRWCANRPIEQVEALFLFQWKYEGTIASLEWVTLDVKNCSRSGAAKGRHGGHGGREVVLIRAWAEDACDNAAPILLAAAAAADSLTNSTGELRMYSLTRSIAADANASSLSSVDIMPLPQGVANASSFYFLGEVVSGLAGHAYEYLAPQMWSIIDALGPNCDYTTVTIVVPTLPISSFAMDYYRLIRKAFPEFRWMEIPMNGRPKVLLFSRRLSMFLQPDFVCARMLASLLWPRLRPGLEERGLPKHPVVALLKMNTSSFHFTNRFLTISTDDYEAIQRRFGVVFLREDEPKEQRLWYTNNAVVFFSSSGANSVINRNFASVVDSKLRVIVDFIHPHAEGFERDRCKRTMHEVHVDDVVQTIAVCLNHSVLTVDDFENAFIVIKNSTGVVLNPNEND